MARLLAALVLAPMMVAVAAEPFVNYQAADLVLGQQSFTSSGTAPVNGSTMELPVGIAVSPVTGKVFVAELNRNRILRFSAAASMQSGSAAEAVLGQPSFFTESPNQGGATAANTLNWPRQIFVDSNDRLWVADQENNRVLYYNNASSIITNSAANGVLGQPNLTANAGATTQTGMMDPNGVCVDPAGRLWVADSGNHRVLRFDNPAAGNGIPASAVLGQADFNSSAFGTSATRFNFPVRLAADAAGRLWVSDLSNHRILRFDNAASKPNGGPADGVLGQADFAGGAPNQGVAANARTLSGPSGIAINANGTLFIGDNNNNRIVWFENAAAKSNNAPADGVLGQPDLTSALTGVVGEKTIGSTGSLWLDASGRLWMSDGSYNRVLRFSPDYTKPVLKIAGKKKIRTSRKKLTVKGAASDANGIREVRYKAGKGGFKTAKGTEIWKFTVKIRPGRNVLRIYALDAVGNQSATQKVIVIRQ
jgi:sugar lactone lactonase YvrE